MAKDHGGILNMVLIGGAAYLAYQYFFASGSMIIGTDSTKTGGPGAQPTGTQTTPTTPTQTQTTQTCPPNCGTTPVANPPVLTTTPPATIAPITGTVNGVAYTGTKGSYTQAVLKALQAAANNSASQTIDEWNWYMANRLGFTGFDAGVIDPEAIIAVTGTGRNDSISPTTYINVLQSSGLLPYPSGLTGLAALAAGINRINRHPLAQSAPGNQFYPKPRKVVI